MKTLKIQFIFVYKLPQYHINPPNPNLQNFRPFNRALELNCPLVRSKSYHRDIFSLENARKRHVDTIYFETLQNAKNNAKVCL
jgi:hypothetical protein